MRDIMNAEYLCQEFFSLLSKVVGDTDLLVENLRIDQLAVNYSKLKMFCRDIAGLVDSFWQQNCRL